MEQKELWDAYDENFAIIPGITLVRGEAVPQGMFHLVCDIIVRHEDGTYLLMQRDPRKMYGGMWEASAGGSALKGEDALTCALRELREETGIRASTLTHLGRTINRQHQSVYECFVCETSRAKDSITLQEKETVAYRWVSAQTLRTMPKTELVTYRIQHFVDELNAGNV